MSVWNGCPFCGKPMSRVSTDTLACLDKHCRDKHYYRITVNQYEHYITKEPQCTIFEEIKIDGYKLIRSSYELHLPGRGGLWQVEKLIGKRRYKELSERLPNVPANKITKQFIEMCLLIA